MNEPVPFLIIAMLHAQSRKWGNDKGEKWPMTPPCEGGCRYSGDASLLPALGVYRGWCVLPARWRVQESLL